MSTFTIMLLAVCASIYAGLLANRLARDAEEDKLDPVEWVALAVCILYLFCCWFIT